MRVSRRARVALFAALALTALGLLGATAASAHPSHHAAADGRPRVTLMIGGISKIIYSVATLAGSLGYYDKAGVDVYRIDTPAGIEEADALVAGQIEGAMGYYNHTIDLQSKGKSTECVVQIGLTPGHAILVPTNSPIHSFADFKGKTLGITGTGSSTDFELQYAADKAGVSGSQFTRLPVGAGSTFIAAFQHGQIDGGITSQPTIQTLVGSGQARILADWQNLAETKKAFGGTWPSTCVYMRTDWVKTHKNNVQRLVNAVVWTLKWIQSHSAAQIAAKLPSAYVPGGDTNGYVNAWEASRTFFSADGLMPKDGPPTMLKFLSAFNSTVANGHINLNQTYTNAFVVKADKTKVPPAK
ncbi:MAG: ABC transporter substrate-binding protein [Gaiellaceae bacterium]